MESSRFEVISKDYKLVYQVDWRNEKKNLREKRLGYESKYLKIYIKHQK
jgi:hypothetical protein